MVVVVVVGIAISIAFAGFAVSDVDWHLFWRSLRASNLWWLAPASVALAAGIGVRALRWQLLFVREIRPPFRPVLRALLVGTFFNNVMPGRPGEAIRVFALHQETGAPRAAGLATAVTERICDVLTLLVLLYAVTPWLPHVAWLGRAAAAAAVVGAFVLILGIALAHDGARSLRFVFAPLRRTRWGSEGRIEVIAQGAATGLAALHRPWVALPALLFGFVAALLIGISNWFVLLAFHLHFGIAAGVLVLVTTNLAMILPSTPSGLGVFEAAVVVALRAYGVDASDALSYAVVLHALNTLPFIGLGSGSFRGTVVGLLRRRLVARSRRQKCRDE
jgi:phosphatidylinositol alpha-mannosyltransferase